MLVQLTGPTELEVSDFTEPDPHVHGDAGGEGFGPLQMLAASLALCAAAVLDEYAHGPLATDSRELRLRLRWAYGERPHRVAAISIEISWPALAEDRRAAVRRAVETCTIHRTLEQPPALTTRFSDQVGAIGRTRATDTGPPALESTPPSVARRGEIPISEASSASSRLAKDGH